MRYFKSKLLLSMIGMSVFYFCISCVPKPEVNYKYMGSYSYEIFNDSLHRNNSFLSPDSYGCVIGNLDFKDCGIKIFNVEQLNQSDEYIITIKHPIEKIYTDSDLIRGEAREHSKRKPLDIRLNKSVSADSVYIYRLKPKGKFRLLQP